MSQQSQTCADAAVQQLCAAGLTSCFANPGTTEMFFVSALEKLKSNMRSVLCLHEAVCTGACDGFARIAGSPAVALLHLGPGLGNGLCNLHNAHRARSPALVIVGEHATWHKSADPPLMQDIQALASTVSREVVTITAPEVAVSAVQQALAALAKPVPPNSSIRNSMSSSSGSTSVAAAAAGGGVNEHTVQTCPSSRVVTLVFPHDVSWTPAVTSPALKQVPPSAAAAAAAPSAAATAVAAAAGQLSLSELSLQQGPARLADSPAAQRFLSDSAAALRAAPHGKAALVLGGAALLPQGGSRSMVPVGVALLGQAA
jgi:acetolactate synthase-1/2/3 large subunit